MKKAKWLCVVCATLWAYAGASAAQMEVDCLASIGRGAPWMWYPGDFEVYLAQELHERRLEWGGVTPVMWPQYHHYPTVAFRLDVDLAEEEEVDVWVDGQGRFILPGGIYGNFTDRHMTFTLPKGRGRIEFTLVNSKRLPSILVKGRTVNSGSHWDCEHSTCGAWTKADAADYLTDPAVPPSDFSLPVRSVAASAARSNGKGGLIADFGRERMGFVVFRDIAGSGRVKVIYGESEPEALCDGLSDDRIGKKTTSADMWEYLDLSEAKEFRTDRSRAFRFVNVVPISGKVTVGGVSMLDEYCPLECRGSFRCDDPRVNRIWDVAVETMRLTSREFLIDGVKRDRWIWSGDACQSCLMNYYLFGDREIVKRTIRALRGKDPIWRHVNTIVDYTFYWFCMIGDYYAYTGDADFLRRIYPDMVTMMEFVERRLRPDGLYEKRDNDWVFVDWAPEELENEKGPVAVEQMLLARAYASLADAARLLGRTDESVRYAGKGAAIRARIKPLYWNDDRGGLVHALDRDLKQLGQFTRYANIFGIFDGYFDETERRTVLERCLCNGKVMKIQTPYMRFYELEALCAVGLHESVLAEIRSYWGGMLDLGATTFWELYNPDEKGMEHYAMYGRPFGRSLCHAWGAAPIYLLGRYFLGVEPAAPGFSRYRVRPSLGGLKWMEGDVPTPHGAIHVRVTPDSVEVKGAPNTAGEVFAFGKKIVVCGAEEKTVGKDRKRACIVDRIERARCHEGENPRFTKAFEFLRRKDLAELPVGRYEIDGSNCWAMVQVCELTPFGGIQHPEVHRDFIDIQAPLDGPETYGFYDTKGKLFEPFDAEKDIGFADVKTEPLTLHPGEFVIFFPGSGAHAPCMTLGLKAMRKKLVIKVRK